MTRIYFRHKSDWSAEKYITFFVLVFFAIFFIVGILSKVLNDTDRIGTYWAIGFFLTFLVVFLKYLQNKSRLKIDGGNVTSYVEVLPDKVVISKEGEKILSKENLKEIQFFRYYWHYIIMAFQIPISRVNFLLNDGSKVGFGKHDLDLPLLKQTLEDSNYSSLILDKTKRGSIHFD